MYKWSVPIKHFTPNSTKRQLISGTFLRNNLIHKPVKFQYFKSTIALLLMSYRLYVCFSFVLWYRTPSSLITVWRGRSVPGTFRSVSPYFLHIYVFIISIHIWNKTLVMFVLHLHTSPLIHLPPLASVSGPLAPSFYPSTPRSRASQPDTSSHVDPQAQKHPGNQRTARLQQAKSR